MSRQRRVLAIAGVLILAICLPTGLSIWLTHRQAEKQFALNVDAYASRVLVRTKSIVSQAATALSEANNWQGNPCSPEHLQLMRQVAFSHSYIQEVVWLENSVAKCSSMQSISLPVTFPAPMRITQNGESGWYTTVNDLGLNRYMVALGQGHSVVMINPDSFIDVVPQSATPIDLAIVGLKNDTIFSSSHPLDKAILKRLKQQSAPTLHINHSVYTIRYYHDLNLAIVSWSSVTPIDKFWFQQLMIWLPFSALLSLLSVLLLLRLLRRLKSPRFQLEDAMAAKEICVHYQPIVCLKTGKIVGAEALSRWKLADGAFLSPDIFIPLAEQTGLITTLTEYIVTSVFSDLGKWLHKHPNMHVSINLAPEDLASTALHELIRHNLQFWEVQPSQIALELTERQFAAPEISQPLMAAYRNEGHSIYLDDFGTGYSSLSYLKDLNIDVLKIDKSFIGTLKHQPVTPHIIEMAKTLQMEMVAEGIETDEQRHWLSGHGVQFGQGWLFSKARPKTEFILWAETNLKAAPATE
jgi:sensor c-di-GMP phosphodiesterase-like protein